jgi:predicted small metal-binding protein
MTLSTVCKRCKNPITADTEDDLVAQVQAHARDHGGARATHIPDREQILTHLHRDAESRPGD